MGYPDWWDHSQAPRKKYPKNTPTAIVAKTNTEESCTKNAQHW